ncbi:MAG: ABC transporter permease [Planctomycetales bacterium]|nr:ABC transporter permease [Planctomycetales bacterium]
MSLLTIAWRSIQQRGLASLLTTASMALGVSLVVAVLLISGIVAETFRNNASLGYNLIVGAKGGDLQIVLNTVFHLSSPVENLPYAFYQEFLPAAARRDRKDGQYAALVDFAIPMCMGDRFQGFRVVGTTPQLFDNYYYDIDRGRKYEFAAGRNFITRSPEYGYFEAVLGARVADETGLKVGDAFSPTHGLKGDDSQTHDEFYVVGILAPSGTPNDRAAFVNMEGFLLLEGHSRPVVEGEAKCPLCGQILPQEDMTAHTESAGHEEALEDPSGGSLLEASRRELRALPISQREVTAILVKTKQPIIAIPLKNELNEGVRGRAVQPIREIENLFTSVVGPIRWTLLLITVMICVVSGISILVSIYNSMSDRRHEIAIMRALGAGRRTVMFVVLLESIMLALGGGLIGWSCGHLLIGAAASGFIERRTGVQIGIFDLAPAIKPFELGGESPIMDWGVSTELLLVPGLILLAVLVGLLPALSAYRTDVAKSLSANP